MKGCSYCGKEYAEAVTVCPIDGQPLNEKEANTPGKTPQPVATQSSFTVKLVSPISASGTYRVFVERSDLLFIQIAGGTKSVIAALAPVLGPAGGLITFGMWLFANRNHRERQQKIMEEQNLEILLRENENSFKLHMAEIREAAIEPSKWLAASGNAGRLVLRVRHGEKMTFEFKTAEEVANAMQLLSALLGTTLRISVEWNGDKQRFQKTKTI